MAAFIPYGRQTIDASDIDAVVEVLHSEYLTTGPAVEHFEGMVCQIAGAKFGVAMSSGTAALHGVMHSLGIGPGDEVIVPPMTFAATANAVLYCGGRPVFADVKADTLHIDPCVVEAVITPRTKAIVGVDYAGQTCAWDELRVIADKHQLALVSDACHSLGAEYKGRRVGTLADVTVFSFHPVKHITTGEGGMVVTNDAALATKARMFRGHGISSTATQREKAGGWFYEMTDLGYNYRITDLQCALGTSQLKKLSGWIIKRNALAQAYDKLLVDTGISPLVHRRDGVHAYHLYVVRTPKRDALFRYLRTQGIGTNVHYIPVHLHPYYKGALGTHEGMMPVAEAAYREILTLPLWPGLEVSDVQRIVETLLMGYNDA